MTIRLRLAAALCAMIGVNPAFARDLSIATIADVAEAQREAYFTPFSQATGLKLHLAVWDGSPAALRANGADWDVVLIDGSSLITGCSSGVLAKLDWPTIGGKDHYQPQAVTDCGVGAFTRHFVLAWDRDKFQGAPSWPDFWDVAKFPGKRGLQRGARMNLEIALIADGVAPGDVYRTLRTDDGVDRAFRKLEQIKPYLVWWKSAAQAPKLLASGDVLLSTAPSDRIAAIDRGTTRRFGTQQTGGLYEVASWAMLKGTPNQADAAKLLTAMGDPAAQNRFTAATGLGGLAKGVTDGMPPDQFAASPSNPALLTSALQIDEQFWHDNADRLDERFDAWLAH
jgi:putative spermidine/putrescine transport system substrate-binding protein